MKKVIEKVEKKEINCINIEDNELYNEIKSKLL